MDPPASDVAETCAIENGACRVSMRERSSIIESGRFVYNCPIPSICGPWCFELFFGTSPSNVEYSDGTSVTSYVMQYVLLKPSIIFHTTGILVPFVRASGDNPPSHNGRRCGEKKCNRPMQDTSPSDQGFAATWRTGNSE